MSALRLEDDGYCFACGRRNPIGLRLEFQWDGVSLSSSFTPKKEHQGYTDVMHGGIIATLLDECMAQAAIKGFSVMAATAEFSMRLRAPLAPGEEVLVSARAERPSPRLITAAAEVHRKADGVLIASATAKLIPVKVAPQPL